MESIEGLKAVAMEFGVSNMVRFDMFAKRSSIKPPVLEVVFYQTASGAEPVR